ncbi:hypothetical protein [Acidisphaera sp. L21]|uniref:hypothetical protein n=1 Tax=Acidisphaera sp. L21 TaxID=1641851 RepID=UPI00131C0C7D|nr:hypothetical protein [Acidisphaera sp. L21]
MASRSFLVCLAAVGLFAAAPRVVKAQTSSAAPSSLNAASAEAWLVKSVCADSSDRAVSADPYPACPSGTHMRSIKLGERLPYRNHDQPDAGHPQGYLYKDNYPVLDGAGHSQILSTIDWIDGSSYGYKPGRDGFDVFTIRDGWVSDLETHSRQEFSTTFFGEGCVPYNGLPFFPINKPIASGDAKLPIFPVHWEQLGQPAPGICEPAKLTRETLTSWRFMPGAKFGGMKGSPAKTMDAVVTTMGFTNTPGFKARGHLEVFYFTKFYGMTRWESWTPSSQPAKATDACEGSTSMTYQGMDFTMSACRDYSATQPAASPLPLPPWPASPLNILQNFHFGQGMAGWKTTGPGMDHAVSIQKTREKDDVAMAPGSPGLSYLQVDTKAGVIAHGAVYQDVPAASVPPGRYSIGMIGRANGGTASVVLSLQQIAADGSLIAASSEPVTLGSTDAARRFDGSTSKVWASDFKTASVMLKGDPRASTIRFVVAPQSASEVDLISAWLLRDPEH